MPTAPNPVSLFPFGEYWDTLPDLAERGYVNPFKYMERMAIYKLMIQKMNQNTAFGLGNQFNPFWGFVSQLDWQWRSGRLASPNEIGKPTTIKPDTISLQSWWSGVNYSLSVVPLIGAIQAGLAPQLEISILKSPPHSKFVYGGGIKRPWVIPAVYHVPVQYWKEFFLATRLQKPEQDLEPIRKLYWKAYIASTTAAISLHTEELELLPKNEQLFAMGWTRMMDFLSEAAWRTDLSFLLENGRGDLPTRLLTQDDIIGAISEMSNEINLTILSVVNLAQQNRISYKFSRYMWSRAMRTREARNQAPKLLRATFDQSSKTADDRKQLQRYIFARNTT
jgi:hypothetical protein